MYLGPHALQTLLRRGPDFPMEQDKIPGFWVVTAWPTSGVVLRMRVAFECADDLGLIFEVRPHGETKFQVLATAESQLSDLLEEDLEYILALDDFPDVWRRQFCHMARYWAVCCWLLGYGSATDLRYPFEPWSSRDCLEFPYLERSLNSARCHDGVSSKTRERRVSADMRSRGQLNLPLPFEGDSDREQNIS